MVIGYWFLILSIHVDAVDMIAQVANILFLGQIVNSYTTFFSIMQSFLSFCIWLVFHVMQQTRLIGSPHTTALDWFVQYVPLHLIGLYNQCGCI